MNNQSTSTIIWPAPTYTAPTMHPEIVKVKRTTRTIEKYNEVGKLIEREIITEEEEIIDKQIWKTDQIKSPYDPPYEVYCGDMSYSTDTAGTNGNFSNHCTTTAELLVH